MPSAKNPFLVIPTLGNRQHSLLPLLNNAGMAAVVIWTGPLDERASADILAAGRGGYGVDLIVDHGPVNIHRWWNRGIAVTASAAGDCVVICNDDVRAAGGALRSLASHVDAGGPEVERGACMLAYLNRPEHAATRVTPITGWCFAINPFKIHPNEGYRWWYGDHDIERQAEAYGPGSIEKCGWAKIDHLRTDWRYDRASEITPLIEADTERWNRLEAGR